MKYLTLLSFIVLLGLSCAKTPQSDPNIVRVGDFLFDIENNEGTYVGEGEDPTKNINLNDPDVAILRHPARGACPQQLYNGIFFKSLHSTNSFYTRLHSDNNDPNPNCDFDDEYTPAPFYGPPYTYGQWKGLHLVDYSDDYTQCEIGGASYEVFNFSSQNGKLIFGLVGYFVEGSGAVDEQDFVYVFQGRPNWFYFASCEDDGINSEDLILYDYSVGGIH